MGWTFTRGATQDDVIQELLADASTLEHELCGNVLWAVMQGRQQKFIACFLLEDGGNGWGYKAMEEGMHPYYYDCPLRLLDLAPAVCEKWRARVRAHHAQQPSSPSYAGRGGGRS
jgi:hypothetical protein